jgi:hypothetical protein
MNNLLMPPGIGKPQEAAGTHQSDVGLAKNCICVAWAKELTHQEVVITP